jgi:hypothetical protein
MGSRIRAAIAAATGGRLDRVIIAGLTDGYLSYTATPEEYDTCGYEGGMTLFGRRQGPRYRDYTAGLAAHLLTGAPAPVSAPEPARTGLGVDQAAAPHKSPDAGQVVTQPEPATARYGKAVFRWKGGDRSVDEPRGQAFVTLERAEGSRWKSYATDDSYADIVMRYKGDEYEDTFQFGPCDARGTYRFVVTGRAIRGGKARDYRVTSRAFQLVAAQLTTEPRAGGGYRVLYPHPATANLALPRIAAASAATPSFKDSCGNATP